MRINEILTESALEEGPILNKIGSAIGKGVGTLAKGVGAVAGGVAGLGAAVKKGFQAGKSTVAGAGDDDAAAPAAVSKQPAAGAAGKSGAGGAADAGGAGGATGAVSKPRASSAVGAAGQDGEPGKPGVAGAAGQDAAAGGNMARPTSRIVKGTASKDSAANDSAYAQAQKAADGLPPDQRKELIAMLQADPKVKAEMEKPVAKKPAAEPENDAGLPANTMANAPVSKVNKAKPGNPNATTPAAKSAATPATTTTTTVKQKSLTPDAFGQMVGGLTKKAG